MTARNAFPSQKVGPETELYAISDLSRVWVMADVFESDAAECADRARRDDSDVLWRRAGVCWRA